MPLVCFSREFCHKKMSMKILIVSRYKAQYTAHVLPFVAEQTASLSEAGCQVELFLLRGNYLKQWKALRAKIREFKPDVIHAHYGLSCLLANLATRRVPVVSTYHGSDINMKSARRFSKIAMWLSAWNIFVSIRNMALAGATEGKKCSLIPCGVELSEGQLMTREEARKALGWSMDEKKVLFAGAFDNEVKDPELAHAVIAYLNSKSKKIEKNTELSDTCSIPNSIDHQSANEQDSLQPNAQSCLIDSVAQTLSDKSSQKMPKNSENGIVELVELKGYTREQVNTWMCAVDALLMTSKTEGSPQVIKEAMACGCPIVSVDVGDVKERLNGLEGCFVAPIVDRKLEIGKLAEALKKAIAFEGKTNGREHIMQAGLSNEQVAEKIINIYRSLTK